MQEFLFAAIVVVIWLILKYFSPEQRLKRFNVEKRIKMQEMQLKLIERLQSTYDIKASVWGAYSKEAQSVKQKIDELKKELLTDGKNNIDRNSIECNAICSRSDTSIYDQKMVQ